MSIAGGGEHFLSVVVRVKGFGLRDGSQTRGPMGLRAVCWILIRDADETLLR